ncbi:porin [Alcaligenes nematophilus]|uniref:porin n=1 Tax=Alcaligenes nematophilus TaxID=2994643 RepID=UPI00384E5CCD
MMRRHVKIVLASCVGLATLIASSSAAAQTGDNVTLYGILDAGLTWISNANGPSKTTLDTGVMQGNRLGLRGSESMGNGLTAIFQLENGFSVATGEAGQGGALWGRQAWVGLKSDYLGSIKLGRQYDFFTDTLQAFYTPTWSAGGYSNSPLDNDRMSGQRVNQSVKYVTPSFAGVELGAMYGFPERREGQAQTGRTISFTANYKNGNFATGAAYTEVQEASLDISPLTGGGAPNRVGGRYLRDWGIGANYAFDKVTIYGVFSQALYVAPDGQQKNHTFRNYQLGFAWRAAPNLVLGPGYGLTTLGSNKYHQLNLTADYFLSKRTDIYTQAIIQHAQGEGATANVISMPSSTGRNQTLLRVGIRTKF